MDTDLKAKWLAALRSGGFEQCRGRLHDGIGFCCLGVLAVVANISLDGRPETADGYQEIYDLIGSAEVARNLAERNDGSENFENPHSFTELADHIESTL